MPPDIDVLGNFSARSSVLVANPCQGGLHAHEDSRYCGYRLCLGYQSIRRGLGDDDDAASSNDDQTAGEGANSAGDARGAIVPDTFLTYDGQQYELKEILQSNLLDETEFTEVGEASEIDVDGDPTVYTRTDETASVYTFFEGNGSGDRAIPDNWYKWEPVD